MQVNSDFNEILKISSDYDDLISAKEHAGRDQDLLDLKHLKAKLEKATNPRKGETK